VVEELAEERRSRGVEGVVAVSGAQLRVGDQPYRPFVQRVAGVQEATGFADVSERRAAAVVRRDEGRQVGKHAPEPVGGRGRLGSAVTGERRSGPAGHRTRRRRADA
jgi:hypothetical protein